MVTSPCKLREPSNSETATVGGVGDLSSTAWIYLAMDRQEPHALPAEQSGVFREALYPEVVAERTLARHWISENQQGHVGLRLGEPSTGKIRGYKCSRVPLVVPRIPFTKDFGEALESHPSPGAT